MRALILLLVLAVMAWVLFLREPAGPEVGLGDGSYQRLELAYATPQPEPDLRVTRTLVPTQGLEGWEGEAADRVSFTRSKPMRAKFDPEQPVDPQRIPALALLGVGAKRARIPGSYDPREFTQVVVVMTNYGNGPESVRVVLERGGRPVLTSPWLAVPTSDGFALPVVYDMPHARRMGGSFDALAVEFKGNSRGKAIALNSVDLQLRPPAAFLPRPPGTGRLVTVAGEERRALGLSSRVPLVAQFEVPTGGELSFSCGLDQRLRVIGEQPEITVTLEADGVESITKEYSLESRKNDAPRWHEDRIDLAAWAGKQARVRFELKVAGEHEGLAVIAEAAVSHRGEDAATVVLVTSDTHRADHLSATGDKVQTPVLDALAARGVLYTNTYASTNVTNPSHVALMTATSPRDTHIVNNSTPLAARATTLAERFAQGGYRTYAAVSAYHLLHSESGLGQGFDRLNGPKTGERDGAHTLDLLDGWLRDAAGQPLFVWLHLFDAHAPYKPVGRYAERYWDGGDPYSDKTAKDMPDIQVPGFLNRLRDKDYPYAMYRGEVDYVDELMGRFLEHPRIAASILAFTADHGESFGEHGVWWDHAELFPETVHVPLILVWPGGPAGVSTQVPVEQLDLGRTLLDLAGLDSAEFPGRGLSWALDTPSATLPRFQIAAHRMVVSLQSGDWLLHLHLRDHQEWALERPREAHEVQLFNLAQDPACLDDLAKDPAHLERARRLRQALIQWVNDGAASGLGTTKIMTEDAMESLAGMGYLGGEESSPPSFESDPENNAWDAYFEGQ